MAYSGKQFEAYISLQSDALGTNDVSGTLYKMRLAQVDDIDFSAGVQVEEVERTGQRVLRETDYIAVRGGGSYTWSFSDYVVESEEMLQLLLRLATEDASSAYELAGNQATATYAEGGTGGEYACVVISSPDTDKDRLMFSSILQELTLSMDATNGGRLRASGTFFSGYQPVIGSEGTSPDATAVNYTKGLFDCSTQTIGGSAVLANSFDVTISNPAIRSGYKTVNSTAGEPTGYNRGGQINVTGNISVKMDDTTVVLLNSFLGATSTNVSVGDGSSIDFDIPTAKFTAHELDTANEQGTFINLPFKGTATGTGKLISIIAT